MGRMWDAKLDPSSVLASKKDEFAELQARCEAQSHELTSSYAKIASLENAIRELRLEFTAFRDNADGLVRAHEQRHQCETLCAQGRISDATRLFLEILNNTSNSVKVNKVITGWLPEFAHKCIPILEELSNTAMESHRYHEAAEHFSTILSLNPVDRVDILIKRSEARVSAGLWEDALCDADEVVMLDPSSHHGYERRHAALHVGKQYTEAVDAFHMMLARLEESPHAHIREIRDQHMDVTAAIQEAIEETVADMPRVLIDTATGRLCDKTQQMAAFKNLLIYDELRSSMTTSLMLDHPRILREVKEFYSYVMLSHRWEKHGEPRYQTVQDISVYELQISSPTNKLQTFCKVSGALGFHWAWSDTCCIDTNNLVVLNESLVAMFTCSRSRVASRREWNKRGWTYQEYVPAETVQFYTGDRKPYLGLDIFNHKESPIIVAEMEQASQVSAMELAALQPGLNRVREKLFLASRRQTTLAEDTAYSLLGIFNAAIPIRYGEGKSVAVGRLLEHILTGSGDVTVLAWTGPVRDYNSCLPPDLTVYNQLVPLHIPEPIDDSEMTDIVTAMQSSLPEPDLTSVVHLYHRLSELSLPSLNSSRLRLPGLAFPVTRVVELNSEHNLRVYHMTVTALGEVEIKTTDDLLMVNRLLLFHPWTSTLLDQDFSGNGDRAVWLDDTIRALRLVARLRQRFGALLLTQVSRVQYRRVATDSLIVAQIHDDTPFTDLIKAIATVDVQ
ncbi:hypothetical protein JVU11DRAFT_8105 [Chiua virens]|nr:hypothetical protein JVU11DRAFT_8105 [Chiua virens]